VVGWECGGNQHPCLVLVCGTFALLSTRLLFDSFPVRQNVVVMSIFTFFVGIVSLFPAGLAPMAGDSPESGKNPLLIVFVVSALCFPFMCFGTALRSWYLLWRGEEKMASKALAIPVIHVVVIVSSFVLAALYDLVSRVAGRL
jgi:hypothetical protein